MTNGKNIILVTGATGYIGGRLVPRLLDAGYNVRCFVRSAKKLESRPWAQNEYVEIFEGDASDPEDLRKALKDVSSAYYLIHSMIAAGKAYRERDRQLAKEFARVSEECGLKRIIYLGGLGETGKGLSEHLSSRREVEKDLASTSVPVTVMRAAMIIGSGSASFEILRYLVERLPVMTTPLWVSTECQPIAISNVLYYLVKCLETAETTGKTLDIGGADVKTYREIMQIMAEERGLSRRIIIPVPVLTPRLSAYWIHLVTPLSSSIALPLSDGLRNRVVCRDDSAVKLMPQRLLSIREAISEAIGHEASNEIETMWSDAGVIPGDPDWAGGTTFKDERTVEINAPLDVVYREVSRIGGRHGYWGTDFLWKIRGVMDHLIGGPGLTRGRRDAESLAYGDAVDFWRVTDVKENERIQLRAEMKLPGVAFLEYKVEEMNQSSTKLTQTALFKPKGPWGLVYWYLVLPVHSIVFNRMTSGIKYSCETRKS